MSEVKSNRAWREECESLRQQLAAALEACKAKDDIMLEVLECKSTTRPPIRLREALAIQPDDSALKDKAMTTYEQPKDWIERHLVEDPGGLLACEPSRLDTLNEELRLARQANEAQHQQLAECQAAIEGLNGRFEKDQDRIACQVEQLADSQKREVMLRNNLQRLHDAGSGGDDNEFYAAASAATKILAATADLDKYVLCEKEPVAWYDKHGMVTHDPFEGAVPIHRAAKEQGE